MENILNKDVKEICKEILKQINNQNVEIQAQQKAQNSLYVFLNNTIYISDKVNPKLSKEEQNKAKLLVISHECAHSIQAKWIQILNFLFSNLEIVLFLLFVGLAVFFKEIGFLAYTYSVVALISIVIRGYLEIDATINSVKISINYLLANKCNEDKVKGLVKFYKNKLLKKLPCFIFMLYAFKIIRLVIVMII